jgi:hypothetical protein
VPSTADLQHESFGQIAYKLTKDEEIGKIIIVITAERGTLTPGGRRNKWKRARPEKASDFRLIVAYGTQIVIEMSTGAYYCQYFDREKDNKSGE